jgi:Zn-finger nucleic acid-binding protein
MKCPRCKNELRDFTVGSLDLIDTAKKIDIHLDSCDRCEGTWFDRGELSAFTGVELSGHRLTEKKAAVLENCPGCGANNSKLMQNCVYCQRNSQLLCPRCSNGIEHTNLLGFGIEYCSHCYGMWLDKGEALSIAAAVNSETPGTITCARCGKKGLTLRDSFCSADGPVCQSCVNPESEDDADVSEWFSSYSDGRGGLLEIIFIIGNAIRTRLALKRIAEDK